MQYIKLTEENDWEGETWNFYIPIENNKDAIKALSKKLNEFPEDIESSFTLHDSTILEEYDVDVLVKHSEGGYYHQHNKMVGVIDTNTFIDVYCEDFEEKIYKGNLEYIGLFFAPRSQN